MNTRDKTCISFGGTFEEYRQARPEFDFFEIRMDLCNWSKEQYREVFSSEATIIAASKSPGYKKDLTFASAAGADYIDIDVSTDDFELLLDTAKRDGTKTILSYHNYDLTPSRKRLISMVGRVAGYGADICKICCMPLTDKDVLRMIKLYTCDELAEAESTKLISFALGKKGRLSRIAAVRFGAPYMYCAIDEDKRTASGQLTARQFREISDICM